MQKDSNFEEKLDFILSKHLENMRPEEFASICTAISSVDKSYNLTLENNDTMLQSFLKESVMQTEQWLSDNAFSLNDLPAVIVAYSNIME